MTEDADLLRRYSEERSEEAFAELVRRHLPLVYACALRRVGGDSQLAEDVTQQVFRDVARRAKLLACRPVLSGWLFTSTRFAAAKAMRTVRRRLEREQEAYIMQELHQHEHPQIDWEKARPVLDDLIGELNERDREAILLRFFEHRDYSSIGARLSLTDNAARMRVERALEKLRTLLARRGVTSTAAAIATVLVEQTAVALPTTLATNVTAGAIAAGSIGTGAAAAFAAHGALVLMSVNKVQVGIASALIVAAGAGGLIQARHIRQARSDVAVLQQQNTALASVETEKNRLKSMDAEIASFQSDEVVLAQLRNEAAALKTELQATESSGATAGGEKSARPRPSIGAATSEALKNLRPLQDAKDWTGMISVIDGLIPQLDPNSYDMAYVLDIKAKLHLQMGQPTKAIEPWEKALQLSNQFNYFDPKLSREIARYVAQLRYQAGLTTTPPPAQWF